MEDNNREIINGANPSIIWTQFYDALGLFSKQMKAEYTKRMRANNPLTWDDDKVMKSEAFLFDAENPSWLIINAGDVDDAYCDPTNIGMMALHKTNNPEFVSERYEELSGGIKYGNSPKQSLRTGEYVGSPNKREDSMIIVRFPGWISGLDEVEENEKAESDYYTLDGMRVTSPTHGIYILRKGVKVSKVIL